MVPSRTEPDTLVFTGHGNPPTMHCSVVVEEKFLPSNPILGGRSPGQTAPPMDSSTTKPSMVMVTRSGEENPLDVNRAYVHSGELGRPPRYLWYLHPRRTPTAAKVVIRTNHLILYIGYNTI